MARGAPVRFDRWVGGYNPNAGPYNLKDDESPSLLNVVASPRGAIRKRDGLKDVGADADLAEQPKSIGRITGVSGATKIVAAGDTSIFALEPATAAVTLFSSGTNGFWSFVQAAANGGQGPLYMMNGVDAPQQWTGATGSTAAWTASAGTLPNGRYMVFAANRLFVAGVTAEESSLYFSEIGNPRDWPVENVVQFDPGDGEPITGLGVVGNYVLVFKPNKIWAVYDLDSGANRRVGSNTGTNSPRSIVETEKGTFFLDPDQGVMVTDGRDVKRLSEQISPDLDAIRQEHLDICAAAWWRNHYYLSVPDDDGVPEFVFDYDAELKSWWRHDCASWDYLVTDFPTNADTVLRDELLFGLPASTARWVQFFRPGQRSDQVGATQSAIPFSWKSAPHTLDGQVQTGKRVAELRIDGQGGTANLLAYRDFNTAPDPLGEIVFGSGTDELWGSTSAGRWGETPADVPWGGMLELSQVRVHTLGVARTWAFAISGSSTEDFELDSYVAFVGPHKRTD